MAGPQRNLNDKDIVNLLSRLKSAEAKYPSDLLSKRRAGFMAGVAAFLSGTGTSPGAGNPGAPPGGGHVGASLAGFSQVDKLIIAIELIVLSGMTTFLAATAYTNRDYLEHLLFPGSPTAVQAVLPALTSTPEPSPSLITPATGTTTATWTPEEDIPTLEGDQAEDTPQPNATKPGLHLGQTKNPPGTPGP